jgi:hypothetical protein
MNNLKNTLNNINAKLDRLNESMDSRIRTQKLRSIMNSNSPRRPAIKADIVDVLRSLQS